MGEINSLQRFKCRVIFQKVSQLFKAVSLIDFFAVVMDL
jgi:hypothetical protein